MEVWTGGEIDLEMLHPCMTARALLVWGLHVGDIDPSVLHAVKLGTEVTCRPGCADWCACPHVGSLPYPNLGLFMLLLLLAPCKLVPALFVSWSAFIGARQKCKQWAKQRGFECQAAQNGDDASKFFVPSFGKLVLLSWAVTRYFVKCARAVYNVNVKGCKNLQQACNKVRDEGLKDP